MDLKTFNTFRRIVYEKSGININSNKEALVSARVGKRLRELGMSDPLQYLAHLTGDTTGEEMVHLLDVISTNVTSFFREEAHFAFLTKVTSEWYSQGQRKFRIWCAASSTGEEPYTIAMTMAEVFGGRAADLRILATDISTRVLQKAVRGSYPLGKLEGVPPGLRSRYFDDSGEPGHLQVVKELRSMLTFTRLNLSQPPFAMNGPFDIIFCRNVMIYFDNVVRKGLLEEAFRLLKKGGYLFVGHAESLTGLLSGFKAVMPSVYIKP